MMRRFYKTAGVIARPDGRYGIALDGKPLKTPARHDHAVPTRALAQAIAEEWEAQEKDIRPATMPLTTLAATTLDRVNGLREAVINDLLAFARTDLVCYRAEHPAALVELERKSWDPLLAWLARRYDIALEVTQGIIAIAQSDTALSRLASVLAANDDFRLAALHALTTGSGSLVIGLAALSGEIDAETTFLLGQLDELYQAEKWGVDSEADQRRAALRADIGATLRFVSLLGDR